MKVSINDRFNLLTSLSSFNETLFRKLTDFFISKSIPEDEKQQQQKQTSTIKSYSAKKISNKVRKLCDSLKLIFTTIANRTSWWRFLVEWLSAYEIR